MALSEIGILSSNKPMSMHCLTHHLMTDSYSLWLINICRHLEPGGYLECQDYGVEIFNHDGTRPPDNDPQKSAFGYYLRLLHEASEINGSPIKVIQSMKERFDELGLEDVKEHRAVWPIGDWPKDSKLKELGRWGRLGAIDSIVPFALGLLKKTSNLSHDEIMDLCALAKKDIGKGGSKYYCEG